MIRSAKEILEEGDLEKESSLFSDINISIPRAKSYRANPEVYHSYTDNPAAVLEVVQQAINAKNGEWNGHIVTTLGAGWPMLFLENGASRTTIVEVNFNQAISVLSKLEKEDKLAVAKQSLADSNSHLIIEDITKLKREFWAETLQGNEVIWLSNIFDHSIDNKFAQRFLIMLKSIKLSIKVGQKVDIIFSYRNYERKYQHAPNILLRYLKRVYPRKGYDIMLVDDWIMNTERDKYAMHNIAMISITNTSEA